MKTRIINSIILARKVSVFIILIMLMAIGVASAAQENFQEGKEEFAAINKLYIAPVEYDDIELSPMNSLAVRHAISQNSKVLRAYELVKTEQDADAILQINVLGWGQHKYWHAPETVTEMKEQVVVSSTTGAKTTISTPVKKTIPGYYIYNQYVEVEFIVTTKEGKVIWERIDNRSSYKAQKSMFNRIVKDFFKDLNRIK